MKKPTLNFHALEDAFQNEVADFIPGYHSTSQWRAIYGAVRAHYWRWLLENHEASEDDVPSILFLGCEAEILVPVDMPTALRMVASRRLHSTGCSDLEDVVEACVVTAFECPEHWHNEA